MSQATVRELLEGLHGMPVSFGQASAQPISSPGRPEQAEEARTVDDAPFAVIDVPESHSTGFTHFLDGAQRTYPPVYSGFTPVLMAHVSAGIVERQDRLMRPPPRYRALLGAFVPKGTAAVEALGPLSPRVAIVAYDVPEDRGLLFDELAVSEISEYRNALERELAAEFQDGSLLVDGGIGQAVRSQGEQPFVVGMVKSHRKQYFSSPGRAQMILSMRAGQRSSLFWRSAHHPSEESVWSFYLKLHSRPGSDPWYGLVRIEVPARDEFRGRIDEIAGWVMHERAPLSLPDHRYDRMLYPIRAVEQHLKARQPSDASIRAIIGV